MSSTDTVSGWTYPVYEKTKGTSDYSDLVELLRVLNNVSTDSFVTEFGALFDVNTFLKQAAIETFLQASDSFVYSNTHFYLYHRTTTDQMWAMIPHDFDQIFGSGMATKIYDFVLKQSSSSPLIARIFANSQWNSTFQDYFRTILVKVFGSQRNADALAPDVRYQRLLNFTWPLIQRDPFWKLSNGLSDYSSYWSSAVAVIGALPNRYMTVQAELDSYLPAPIPDDEGLSTGAKWGIGIACVVFLGGVLYCCWSRSRKAQYEAAAERLATDDKEPIGFGSTSKTYEHQRLHGSKATDEPSTGSGYGSGGSSGGYQSGAKR